MNKKQQKLQQEQEDYIENKSDELIDRYVDAYNLWIDENEHIESDIIVASICIKALNKITSYVLAENSISLDHLNIGIKSIKNDIEIMSLNAYIKK